MDELIVGDRQTDNFARHLWRDLHDIGAHGAIARPWGPHVILPRAPAEQRSKRDSDECRQNRQGVHRRQSRATLNRGRGPDDVGFQFDAGHQRPQRAMTRTIEETIIT